MAAWRSESTRRASESWLFWVVFAAIWAFAIGEAIAYILTFNG